MIHPTAIVEFGAKIGSWTKVWHNAHIREGATIGKNCTIGKGVYIDKNVTIGDNCKIQNYACIYQGVTIGNNVFIGPHVCFTNDKYPKVEGWSDERITKTIVKDNVSIGANATIICGVTLHENVEIGAGSVVTKNIIPFVRAYGNPAKAERIV